jgi:hypothetical protein
MGVLKLAKGFHIQIFYSPNFGISFACEGSDAYEYQKEKHCAQPECHRIHAERITRPASCTSADDCSATPSPSSFSLSPALIKLRMH